MVNVRWEEMRLMFYFASARHFHIFNWEKETSKCYIYNPPDIDMFSYSLAIFVKKWDCKIHITTEKQDCKTSEIWQKFCKSHGELGKQGYVNPMISEIFSPNLRSCSKHFQSNLKPLCLKNFCGIFSLQQYVRCLNVFSFPSFPGWVEYSFM